MYIRTTKDETLPVCEGPIPIRNAVSMNEGQEMGNVSTEHVYQNFPNVTIKPNQVAFNDVCMPKEKKAQHNKPKRPVRSEPENINKPLTGPVAKAHDRLPIFDGTLSTKNENAEPDVPYIVENEHASLNHTHGEKNQYALPQFPGEIPDTN